MALLTTFDPVSAHRRMKVRPTLNACDPVTYEADNLVLKFLPRSFPYVPT